MANPADTFDLDDPKLPDAIKDGAMRSGNYPHERKLDKKIYQKALKAVQIELVKLQAHMLRTGERNVLVFEGRDAAGKGGTIERYRENLNPRQNIAVALPKPSDREASQWYFQRYIDWLPAAGETVLFDRSWYNRAGVERVMDFGTAAETRAFLAEAPRFESMLVGDGIRLFKFWLSIGREMQLRRFHDRRHDPLKIWKLSPIDLKALNLWDAYSKAIEEMLPASDGPAAPWTVVLANDKRRARIAVIQTVLTALDYAGKDSEAIGAIDGRIVMGAEAFLARND